MVIERQDMRVSDAIDLFLRDRYLSNCRPATVRTYRFVLGGFGQWLSRRKYIALRKLRAEALSDYLADRLLGGTAARTVHTERVIILGFVSFLQGRRLLPAGDWRHAVRRIHVDASKPRCLSPEDMRRLCQAASCALHYQDSMLRARDIALIRLFIDRGLRVTETLALKVQDIDLETGRIRVRAESAKSRRERIVWVGHRTLEALRAYGSFRAKRQARTEAFFITHHGRALYYSGAYRIISRIGRLAGIDDLHPHVLRHSCATMLLRCGMPLEYVREVLGHANLRTTELYLHLLDDDLRGQCEQHSPVDRLLAGD